MLTISTFSFCNSILLLFRLFLKYSLNSVLNFIIFLDKALGAFIILTSLVEILFSLIKLLQSSVTSLLSLLIIETFSE